MRWACAKFAQDIGETLTDFYSVDKWKSTETGKSSKRSTKKHLTPCDLQIKFQKVCKRNCGVYLIVHQKIILESLSLCMEMPIMIKYNEATECCVTHGAEAVVVGWKSHLITEDRETLIHCL